MRISDGSSDVCSSDLPRTVADLSSHNCLGYTLSSALGPHQWSFGVDGAVVVPVSGNLQAGQGGVLVAAAGAGVRTSVEEGKSLVVRCASGGWRIVNNKVTANI